ncbi:MAG: GGDEF domain-containing protein, partial [Planctomycetota bacterium]
DGGRLTDQLRRRYPDWEVTSTQTFMSGIGALSSRGARAVVAFVDASTRHAVEAVAGLREAAGDQTRLLLCCPPEAEPAARTALAAGADDYLLYPVQPDELDHALQYSRPDRWSVQRVPAAPAASMDELTALGDVLANLDAEPTVVLQGIAEMVRLATGADGATVVVKGTVACSGTAASEPVLAEPIESQGELLGQISLGPRGDSPYTSADADKLRHYAGLIANLLAAALRHRRWRELAITDELSGLPNRRYLTQFLDDILARAARERFCVTLLIFDIDDFKTYNDTCGHEAGDEIIRLAAQLFRRHCREHDVVTRYGGDEFAVIFWDAEEPRQAESQHPGDALEVLQRFTQDLGAAEPSSLKKCPESKLTISGGLATFPWDASNREDLIRRADQALLQAKAAGKNRIFTIGQPAEEDPESPADAS